MDANEGIRMIFKGWAAVCATVLGSAAALAGCAARPIQLVNGLHSPRAWVADVGPDAAVAVLAGALLWLVALWTAIALSATALALLPGRLGLIAGSVSGRLSPAVLRRMVAAAAGTSILISPVAGFAEPAGHAAPAGVGTSTTLAPGPALATAGPPLATAAPAPAPELTVGLPMDRSGARQPAVRGRLASGPVTVRPGDSLWTIAAHRLGNAPTAARIHAEWPRWYAANRQLIGADPNLLHPGASLQAPRLAVSDTGE